MIIFSKGKFTRGVDVNVRKEYLNRSVRAGMKRKGRNEERRQDVKGIMHLLVRSPSCVLVLSDINNQVEVIMDILFIANEEAAVQRV